MVDVKARLISGEVHEADSTEVAFNVAGALAFRNAWQKVHPRCLNR